MSLLAKKPKRSTRMISEISTGTRNESQSHVRTSSKGVSLLVKKDGKTAKNKQATVPLKTQQRRVTTIEVIQPEETHYEIPDSLVETDVVLSCRNTQVWPRDPELNRLLKIMIGPNKSINRILPPQRTSPCVMKRRAKRIKGRSLLVRRPPKEKLAETGTVKSGPMPSTAYAAKKLEYASRSDNCWKESSGARLRAAEMWDERVNEGKYTRKPPQYVRTERYMKYMNDDRIVKLPSQIPTSLRTSSDKCVVAVTVLPEVCTVNVNKRMSAVTGNDVADIRRRGRQLADKLKAVKMRKPKEKVLLKKMNWRFVKAFKQANQGIIWVQHQDRRKSQMSRRDQLKGLGLIDSDLSDSDDDL
jgi:hypothetical protein